MHLAQFENLMSIAYVVAFFALIIWLVMGD